MANLINCPSCSTQLDIPPELMQQAVACPTCNAEFIPSQVNAPAEPDPTPSLQKTKPCPYCAEEILIAAKKCKHCGEFIKPKGSNAGPGFKKKGTRPASSARKRTASVPVKEKKKTSCLGRALLVFTGIIVLLIIIGSLAPEESTSSSRSVEAFSYSKAFVKKNLKSPASAKFSSITSSDSWHQNLRGNIYYTGGYVDSQNGFGAMIRSKWEVCVEYLPASKKWKLVFLKVGDQTIGKIPDF